MTLPKANGFDQTASPMLISGPTRNRLHFMDSFMYLALAVAAYFLPTIVSAGRNTHNQWGVFVINLFLGWTLLGWVIALAMAAGGMKKPS